MWGVSLSQSITVVNWHKNVGYMMLHNLFLIGSNSSNFPFDMPVQCIICDPNLSNITNKIVKKNDTPNKSTCNTSLVKFINWFEGEGECLSNSPKTLSIYFSKFMKP